MCPTRTWPLLNALLLASTASLADDATGADVAFLREHVHSRPVDPLGRRVSADDRYAERA